MSSQKLRYVFTDYKNIRAIKFKKLEQICDKLFILIDASVEYIPLPLVRDIQKLGKAAKWVTINDTEHGLDYHIIYLMGKLHTKVSKEIEFAVLSENDELSSVIRHINGDKRNCLRIRIKSAAVAAFTPSTKTKNNNTPTYSETPQEEEVVEDTTKLNSQAPKDKIQKEYVTTPSIYLSEKEMLLKAAHSTIERLQLTSKDLRPFNRATLVKYLEFNNQQWTEKEGRTQIMLDYLISHGYIKFEGDIVKYYLPEPNLSVA